MKPLKQCLSFAKINGGCGLVTLALALAWPAHGADPVLIGQWPGKPRGMQEGFAMGVAVSGNYAYVADGSAGLQVIDVSNLANPQRVGGYNTSGDAYIVAVSGNYAYVADRAAGLQVIDVSNPANPQWVGVCDTRDWAPSATGRGPEPWDMMASRPPVRRPGGTREGTR